MNLSRARLEPFRHQPSAVEFIFAKPYSMNASEMGTGKTKIIIDTACLLYLEGLINRVIVISPSGIRGVWAHRELGELQKHLWKDLPAMVTEWHVKTHQWYHEAIEETEPKLRWIITNYEWVRDEIRLKKLISYCGPKTLLVLDESSAVKNPQAAQTKACLKLRRACGRVHLMNGTPVAEGAGDLFSQGNLMHPSILDCPSKTQFNARYAIEVEVRRAGGDLLMTKWGKAVKTVKGWRNLEDLEKRFAPYVIRYMKKDCLDLPEKLPTVPLIVPLKESWSTYKEMREDAITWLSHNEASMSPQITTKMMRLSQITSGFLGGVQENDIAERESDDYVEVDPDLLPPPQTFEREVGREKLDFFMDWLEARIAEDPLFKVMVWSRHRHEILRTHDAMKKWGLATGMIIGGQSSIEREETVRLLDPRTTPTDRPVVVIGSPFAGGKGLTLTATHTVVYMSNAYSLSARLQSEDRVHRAGQRNVVSYFDLIATGPNGQKTVDIAVIQALQQKEDLSSRTSAAWLSILREEG